jgi:hypothetical protein
VYTCIFLVHSLKFWQNYKLLQTPDQSILTTYMKIRAYRRSFVSPVVIDVGKSIVDLANRLGIDQGIENLPDCAFQDG